MHITLGRYNHTLVDNIKKKEDEKKWAQCRNQRWAAVSTVRNIWVHKMKGIF